MDVMKLYAAFACRSAHIRTCKKPSGALQSVPKQYLCRQLMSAQLVSVQSKTWKSPSPSQLSTQKPPKT